MKLEKGKMNKTTFKDYIFEREIRNEFFKYPLKFLVLELLEGAKPGYLPIYEIHKQVNTIIDVSYVGIRNLVRKLKKKELVKDEPGKSMNGIKIIFYCITKEGNTYLNKARQIIIPNQKRFLP